MLPEAPLLLPLPVQAALLATGTDPVKLYPDPFPGLQVRLPAGLTPPCTVVVIANDRELPRHVRKIATHAATQSLDCRTITLLRATELGPQQASLIALSWQKSL